MHVFKTSKFLRTEDVGSEDKSVHTVYSAFIVYLPSRCILYSEGEGGNTVQNMDVF